MASPMLISAVLRAARLEAAASTPVTTAKKLLEQLMRGQFTQIVGDGGKILTSTNMAGRQVQWQALSDLTPTEIMMIAESAWRLDDELGEDDIPSRRINKLNVKFTNAKY